MFATDSGAPRCTIAFSGSIAAMLGSAIVRHELGIDFKGVMLSSPIIGPGAM